MDEILKEKLETIDINSLDMEDEIFKLKLVVSYLASLDEDTTSIENFLECIADKFSDIRTGYNYAFEYLIRNKGLDKSIEPHIMTA